MLVKSIHKKREEVKTDREKIYVENNMEKIENAGCSTEKGTTFTFEIPYYRVDGFKVKEPTDKGNRSVINEVINLKILLAEDDHMSQKLMTIFLKPFAKIILKVSTGTDAIEECLKNPDIDLVMMDNKMPVMDGNEATREIRKFNKTVVIIAQTAFGFKEDRANALAAGCNDYISKPISQAAFNMMIHKLFSNREV